MIRKVFKRDKGLSDLWIGWSHEENLYWTILPKHSRRGWWFWSNDRIMLRVYVTRDHQDSELIGWIRGHIRIDPVHQIRVMCCLDQYGIEIQVLSTWRNRSCSWIVIHRGQAVTWMYLGMTEMTPPKTLRWWVLQALSNTRSNIKHWGNSRVEATETIESDKLHLNPVLPAIMSTGILLIGKSRKDWQHSYDIEKLLIEKLNGGVTIGVLCIRSNDVISNVKVLEPSLILNGRVMSTKEATNPGFSIAWGSNNNLLYVRAMLNVGRRIDCSRMNHVALSLRWKGHFPSRGKLSHREHRSYRQDSSQVERTLKKGDKRSSSDLWTVLKWRHRRSIRWLDKAKKCTLQEQVENFSRTQPIRAHFWKKNYNKMTEYNSGRPGSHAIILLWLSAGLLHWKSGKAQRWQNFVLKNAYATTGSENRVEECLATGARKTIKQGAMVCGERPLQNWSPFSRSTTWLQYLKIKEE